MDTQTTVPVGIAVDLSAFITSAPRAKRAPASGEQNMDLNVQKRAKSHLVLMNPTSDVLAESCNDGANQERIQLMSPSDTDNSQLTLDWLDDTCTALQSTHMLITEGEAGLEYDTSYLVTKGSTDVSREDLHSSDSSDLAFPLTDDRIVESPTHPQCPSDVFMCPQRCSPFPWQTDSVVQDSFRYMRSMQGTCQITTQACSNCLLTPSTDPSRPTLILDLDETLVHSKLDETSDTDFHFVVDFNDEEHDVHVGVRPGVHQFLEFAAQHFEVAVFTASLEVYAEKVLDYLDPDNKYFAHRMYRDACVVVDNGLFVKDLSLLGRDLSRCVILDNSPAVFSLQVENGLLISSWYGDEDDNELAEVMPVLQAMSQMSDVRPMLRQYLDLERRIACS